MRNIKISFFQLLKTLSVLPKNCLQSHKVFPSSRTQKIAVAYMRHLAEVTLRGNSAYKEAFFF